MRNSLSKFLNGEKTVNSNEVNDAMYEHERKLYMKISKKILNEKMSRKWEMKRERLRKMPSPYAKVKNKQKTPFLSDTT